MTYLKLAEYIFHFENSLEDDDEVGARLISAAADVSFYLQDIGYCDPHMITFSGVAVKGEKLQLVQNVAQLNVCLVALKKREEEPARIGFELKRKAEKAR